MAKIQTNELSPEAKNTFKRRTIYALILAAIFVPCIILGGWFYFALFFACIGIAAYEIIKAPKKQFGWYIWAITFIAIYSLIFWVVIKSNFNKWDTFDINKSFSGLWISPIALAVTLFLYFIVVVLKEDFSIKDAFYFGAVLLLLTLGFQSIFYVRYISFSLFESSLDTSTGVFKYFQSALLFFYLIVAIVANDVGAYIVGILFGKHKMNPRISPKKTWEGFFGGIFFSFSFSLTFALVCSHCGFSIIPELSVEKWYWVLLTSFLLPFAGNLGDFTFSAIKRGFDVKDYSKLLGPHGGILDRIDSLLFGSIALTILITFISNGWNFYL